MKVCFVLPDLTLSGGVGVVVQHARRLVGDHGFDVTLAVVRRPAAGTWSYAGLDALDVLPLEQAARERYDLAVATWWETFYELPRLRADRRAYFVQSLEDRFYPPGAPERALAAATYALAEGFVTEAGWLADFLRGHRPDVPTLLVRNGVDKAVHAPAEAPPRRNGEPLRVLIEGHPQVWFKGVEEALAATELMREPRHVTLVHPAPDGGRVPGRPDRVIGPLSGREMAEAMADSDVLLKLSRVEGMAGPPLEAFHAGATCVTTPVTGHEEYVRHGENALVVGWDDPHGTARALDLLARDRDLLDRLRLGALETARGWPDWDEAAGRMAAALKELHATPAAPADGVLAAALADAWGHVAALNAARLGERVAHQEGHSRLVAAVRATATELERWQARALDVHARLNELEARHETLVAAHRRIVERRSFKAASRLKRMADRPPVRRLARLARWVLARCRPLLSRR